MIVAFGDSIANGLGVRGESYPVLLARALETDLADLTGSAMQLSGTHGLRDGAKGADIALIAFGITEAMIRPTERALMFVPRRWRQPGWLDPRPYYSDRRRKRIVQRIESALRWRAKVALIRLCGGTRWGVPATYEAELSGLIKDLQEGGVQTIVVIGHMGHDERFFPGSRASCAEFAELNKRVAAETGSYFLEGAGVCRAWGDFLLDHFHPDRSGHRRIAERLVAICGTAGVDHAGAPEQTEPLQGAPRDAK